MIAACPHWLVATGQFCATLAGIGAIAGCAAFILNRMGFR